MKTYKANFSVNNGTTLMSPVVDTNLQRIRKSIKEIALGERFEGSKAKVTIWDEDDREIEVYTYENKKWVKWDM